MTQKTTAEPMSLDERLTTAQERLFTTQQRIDMSYGDWLRGIAEHRRALAQVYRDGALGYDVRSVAWHACHDSAVMHDMHASTAVEAANEYDAKLSSVDGDA